jgi:hypothetical protein
MSVERTSMSTDRKPPGTSWESFAERRIREAQAAGAFDGLPGLGQPILGIDEPLDEDWWLRKKLREEGVSVIPPALEARLLIERTLAEVRQLGRESAVRRRIEELNRKVREAQLSPAAGPADGVALVDVEAAVAQWKSERARGDAG